MSDSPGKELALLMARAIEGRLGTGEQAELTARLKAEPDSRRLYLQQCRTQGLLLASFGGLVAAEPTPKQVRPVRNRRMRLLVLAAALMMITGLSVIYRSSVDNPVPPTPGPIARVLSCEGNDFVVGDLLSPGPLEVSGKLHLMLDSGAELIVAEHSRLRIESPMRVHLKYGRLSVYAPELAKGFVVTTDRMSVNDLGTAFGVEAGAGKHILLVSEGSVLVTPGGPGARETEIVAGKAVAVTKDKPEEVQSVELELNSFSWDFSRAQPLKKGYVHFRMDEGGGNQVTDSGSGTKSTPNQGHFQYRTARLQGVSPWQAGRGGGGLLLDGTYWVNTPYVGASGARPRTVSLWLKVLPGRDSRCPQALVAWGGDGATRKWQVMLDRSRSGMGGLRVGFGGGFVVGATDLRDGRWHHVAAVFLGGKDVDVRTHIRLYVDGKLDDIRILKEQSVNTGHGSSLVIGYNITFPDDSSRAFQGMLDEVYVFEEALRPDQIRMLMRENKLPKR